MRTWRSENFFSSSRVRLSGEGILVSWEDTREREEGIFGVGGCERSKEGAVPLLNFVEAGEEGDGHEDDDCFLAVADVDLQNWVCVSVRVFMVALRSQPFFSRIRPELVLKLEDDS